MTRSKKPPKLSKAIRDWKGLIRFSETLKELSMAGFIRWDGYSWVLTPEGRRTGLR